MQEVEWEELNDKATTLYQQGDFRKQYLHKVAENTFSAVQGNVATAMNNLALYYCEQGKYTEAEPLYKLALKIRENKLGIDRLHWRTWQSFIKKLGKKRGRKIDRKSKKIHLK